MVVTVPARTSHRIAASYTRRDDPSAEWDLISLLILQEDMSEYPGGIRSSSILGLREDEQRASDGSMAFECRLRDGSVGKPFTFPSSPGQYEIRLCWVRQPKTVAEKIAQSEDPHQFMTPFYRAYVTIVRGPEN